jgi:F0F1-type ATP synthase assembly protein I
LAYRVFPLQKRFNMNRDINELKESWSRAIDSDVIKAATKDWREYSPEAQVIIECEARNRGLWEQALALKDKGPFESVLKKSDVPNAQQKEKPVLDLILKLVGLIAGFVLWKFLGLAPFILILTFIIGDWFSKWYCKRQKISQTLIKWIVWLNVLTWFLPPLGIFTGSAALQFSNHVEQEKKKYKILAAIGIGLSLINAIFGVIIRMR